MTHLQTAPLPAWRAVAGLLLAAPIGLAALGCAHEYVSPAMNQSAASLVAASLAPRASASSANSLSSMRSAPLLEVDEDRHPGRFFIGARAGINAGSGDPTNDIVTYGAFGRYRVRGPLLVGLAVDQATFDFERPGDKLSINTVETVDTTHDATIVTIWGEYEFALADEGLLSRVRPFAGAGLGVGSVSDESATGPIQGGGTFDISVKGGTEIIPGAIGGVRLDVTRNVVFELGLRADFHFTSMEVNDNISSNSVKIDDYPTYGGYVGLLIRL